MIPKHFWKSFLIFGIVLIIISVYPSTTITAYDDITDGTSSLHLIQCTEDPYLIVTQRYNTTFSLYVMTTNDGFKLINGTSIENITTIWKSENITEYSGSIDLQEPGLYLLYIRTVNQSLSAYVTVDVYRGIPQFEILETGSVFIALSLLIHFYPFPKTNLLINKSDNGKNRDRDHQIM